MLKSFFGVFFLLIHGIIFSVTDIFLSEHSRNQRVHSGNWLHGRFDGQRGVLHRHTWSMLQPAVLKQLCVAVEQGFAKFTLLRWRLVCARKMRVVGRIVHKLAQAVFARVRHPNNERTFERVFNFILTHTQ